MSWLDGMRHRMRSVLRPRACREELEEEMRFHVELDAMHEGDVGRARRRFGNRTYYAEEVRRMTWLRALDAVRQDLGSAWRAVRRAPGVTVMIVATLALGIGANTATFAVLNALYLRPPGGVTDPESLRRAWVEYFNTHDGVPFISQSINYPMFRAIAEATGDPDRVAVYAVEDDLRQGAGARAPKLRGVYASANYFTVLGVRPALGRFYSPDEDRLGGGSRVVVVSHDFWRRALDADTAALGRTIEIGRDRCIVVGVADPSFHGLGHEAVDVWIPLSLVPVPPSLPSAWWETTSPHRFRAVYRQAAGAGEREIEQRASLALRAVQQRLRGIHADTLMRMHVGSIIEARGPAEPEQERIVSTRLGGVAIIILLIACANVVNLLLARAVSRRRELALRLALGISRGRLVRLLTVEALLLASLAAAAALVVGWWGGSALRSLLMPETEWATSAMDWRVGLSTLAMALVSGLVAGVVPAVQASDPDLVGALKDGFHGAPTHRSRLRSGLVVTQAALSVVLLVGATLFVRSLRNVQSLDTGYDAGRLIFGSVNFADGERPPGAVEAATMRDVARRLEARPGVEAVARAWNAPMWGFSFVTFYTETDSSGSFDTHAPTVAAVSPEYFRTAGLRLLRGRGFSADGARAGAGEIIVNETAARVLWRGREAIGRCIRLKARENPCFPVVGVVEDARLGKLIEEQAEPQIYAPIGAMPTVGLSQTGIVMARAEAGSSTTVEAELRAALGEAFPRGEPVVRSMLQNLEPEYRPWRLGATLFTAFGVLALVVAVVGIYSTVAYGVSQRRHEFGVRIALGARIGDVLRQVVGEGLRTVALGVVLGVGLSIAAGRLVSALLYGVTPRDPLILLAVGSALLTVAVAASIAPAWRAARIDPVTALRDE